MAELDEEKDEETEDEENEESSESVENLEAAYNANVGNTTTTPTTAPAQGYAQTPPAQRTPANTPAAPAAAPAATPTSAPATTQNLDANPYQSNTDQKQDQSSQPASPYDNLTDAQIDYLMQNIDQLGEEDRKTVQALADQRNQSKAGQAQTPSASSSGQNPSAFASYINFDPNGTYGRTGKEGTGKNSYTYSYSTKQLQNEINSAISSYNKNIAKTGNGTSADYMKPLKVDGLMGKETIAALQKLGFDTSNLPGASGLHLADPVSTSAPASSSSTSSGSSVTGDAGSAALAQQVPHTPSTPTGTGAYWDANRDATARDRMLEAINARGQAQTAYNQNLIDALNSQPSRQQQLDDMASNNPEAYMAMAYGLEDPTGNEAKINPATRQNFPWSYSGRNVEVPDNGGRSSVYDNAPVVGNEDANLQDLIEEANRRAERGYLMETPSAPTENSAYWSTREPERPQAPEREPINYNAMADELFQMDRNDWYQRPENQQTRESEREPINYEALADELYQADRNDWYQRPETPQAGSARPERNPINYDALANEMFQADRNDWYSPNQTYNDNYRADLERIQNGGMGSNDIQATVSSETASPEEQDMLAAYNRAMQSAGRARDIFQGLPTQAEQIQQTREQWDQNMRSALENQFNNPYMQQFRQDFDNLQRQFPNYSYSALADMVLFNEEMRNGQSSYYKWLANSL